MARCIPFRHPLAALATLVVLHLSAQQVVTGEWFMGEDPGHGQANAISFTPGGFISFGDDLSVALDPGFHWFSLRVRDDAGHWSHTHARPVYARQSLSGANVVAVEWFTDEDPGHGQANAISFTPGSFISFGDDLSVALDPGFHWFSLRVRDDAGHWSHTHARPVYARQSLSGANVVAVEWFTDEDPGHGQGEALPITAASFVEVAGEASFPPGELFRWVGLRAQDELSSWSHTHIRPVFVRPETGGVIVSAEWFIGEDPGFGAANPIAIGNPAPLIEDILFEAITQGLDAGDHVVMVRVFNDRGTPSLSYPVAFTIDTGTGMDLQEQLGLTIGPNPTRDLLMLRADRPVEGMHLRLMDSAGRILHQDLFNGSLDLDLRARAQGTYYLFLSDAEGKYTVFPVVKQ